MRCKTCKRKLNIQWSPNVGYYLSNAISVRDKKGIRVYCTTKCRVIGEL